MKQAMRTAALLLIVAALVWYNVALCVKQAQALENWSAEDAAQSVQEYSARELDKAMDKQEGR